MTSDAVVDRVLSLYEGYPVALIGCRAAGRAHNCCEYDFAVINDRQTSDLLGVNGDYAEVHIFPAPSDPFRAALMLQEMKIVSDPSLVMSSLKQKVEEVNAAALVRYAREKAVDGLFYANRSVESSSNSVLVSSLWLKCGAYCYLEAAIARSGARPMPAHMLAQLRSIESGADAGGIVLATSCLALERANKSSVLRCIEACTELNEKIRHDYTTKLVLRKARFLHDSAMYADCYFYLGYVTRDLLTGITSNQKVLRDHMQMISMAMDLTSDQSFTFKHSRQLLGACRALLQK